MHNIETNTEYAERNRIGSIKGWPERALLTVANRGGREISFTFVTENGGLVGPHIVANPWSDNAVAISGEDLYAFRELLNTLPEEAFVRPADPVETPEPWIEGDVVTYDSYLISVVYTRTNDKWTRVRRNVGDGETNVESLQYSDEAIEEILGNNDIMIGEYVIRRRNGVNL